MGSGASAVPFPAGVMGCWLSGPACVRGISAALGCKGALSPARALCVQTALPLLFSLLCFQHVTGSLGGTWEKCKEKNQNVASKPIQPLSWWAQSLNFSVLQFHYLSSRDDHVYLLGLLGMWNEIRYVEYLIRVYVQPSPSSQILK